MRFILPPVGVLVALFFVANPALAGDENSPAGLPQPSWVSMVDRKDADGRLPGFLTPIEIKLELLAENQVLAYAGQFQFDKDGSLLVLALLSESSRDELPSRDALLAIADPAIKNAFDRPKVLLEDEFLSAFLVDGDWLYTASRGEVLRRHRTKNAAGFEGKQVIVHGLGGTGTHPARGLAVDFDGSLLISVGPGVHNVEGSDGSKARVSGTGAVFRCRPDGSKLELLAMGSSQPDGPAAFDSDQHAFQLETILGPTPANKLLQIAEGSDFGFRSYSPTRPDVADRIRQECLAGLPGVMKPLYTTRGDRSLGISIYNGAAFPDFFQGLFLCPEPGEHRVRALKPDRRDSSLVITEAFDLVHGPSPGFNPWQIAIGPDGALYLLDRPQDGGPENLPGRPARPGRLFRISWGGGAAHPMLALLEAKSWTRFARMSDEDLIKSLSTVHSADRRFAQNELISRGAKAKSAVLKAMADGESNSHARTLAAGVLCSMWGDDVKQALIRLATDDDTTLRRAAAECLGRYGAKGDAQIQEVLLHILGDADPITRRSVALAMSRIAAPEADDCLGTSLSFDIGGDALLRDGLVRALERLGKPGLERLLAMADSGEEDLLERAVDSFCAMRSPIALEMLPQLLANPHLQSGQRARLIRSVARYHLDHPRQLVPILHFAIQSHPGDVGFWCALSEVLCVHFAREMAGPVRLLHSLLPSS